MNSLGIKQRQPLLFGLLLLAVIGLFGSLAVAESFAEQWHEHSHDECSSDCGCIHCIPVSSAVYIPVQDRFIDGPSATLSALASQAYEDAWVGAIYHPPRLSA